MALLCFCALINAIAHAQNFAVEFNGGVGKAYIIEDITESDYINYGLAPCLGLNMVYQPLDAYFGARLDVLQTSTLFEGTSVNGFAYTGEISSTTISVMLEHLNTTNKLNLGYFVGAGVTNERNALNWNNGNNHFMSISSGAIMAYSLSERSFLTLNPILLWTDPINTFRPNNWKRGQEDLSAFLKAGFRYFIK